MEDPEPGCDCKVGQTAATYGLQDLADRLGTEWANGDASLRGLADRFNTAALRAAMAKGDDAPLGGEAENIYRLLTDDGVSSGMRTQARRRLEKHDVPVERLETDFVSYQTVNRHVKGCLDVERTEDDADLFDRCSDRIFALQTRTAAVTEDALAQLRDADELAVGEVDVFVDVGVTCRDCGHHGPVDALLEDGCRCESGGG